MLKESIPALRSIRMLSTIAKMKKIILSLFFSLSFLYSNSCSCPTGFKGYKDFPLTLGLSAKVFGSLTLIKIQSIDSTGAKATIINDYCNSFETDSIFINNMNPGWECGYSTDKLKKGDFILSVFPVNNYDNSFSTCFESFINLSNESKTGKIAPTKSAKERKWTVIEIENLFGIDITSKMN